MKIKKIDFTPNMIILKKVLCKNKETLEFYKQHQKTKDILEKIAIALDQKKVFKTIYSSTQNRDINPHTVCSTIK